MDLTNASIRVTGATFSRDELKQSEMLARFNDPCLRYFLGDVRDKEGLVCAMHEIDIVVPAAPLKQIPACEYNPFEAIQTNVVGATNVIDAAIDARMKRITALSTDKAVNSVNLYGATKLCGRSSSFRATPTARDAAPSSRACATGTWWAAAVASSALPGPAR